MLTLFHNLQQVHNNIVHECQHAELSYNINSSNIKPKIDISVIDLHYSFETKVSQPPPLTSNDHPFIINYPGTIYLISSFNSIPNTE